MNSHWHGDHNLGNQAYKAAFPDVRIVAHPGTFADEFAGNDEDARLKFDNWWRRPIARSAWLEARGQPIRQGASDETG